LPRLLAAALGFALLLTVGWYVTADLNYGAGLYEFESGQMPQAFSAHDRSRA